MISKNNLQSHFTHHTKIFSPLHLWSDTHSCQKLQYNAKNPGWITGIFTSFERDSNPRPTHYECVALPTEPSKHAQRIILDFRFHCKPFFIFLSIFIKFLINSFLLSYFLLFQIFSDLSKNPIFVQMCQSIFSRSYTVSSILWKFCQSVDTLHFGRYAILSFRESCVILSPQ